MTAERWEQIKTLLEMASERSESERTAWLAAQCGDDVALRSEVESLLAVHKAQDNFLDDPLIALPAKLLNKSSRELSPGHSVGPYVVEQRIGVGGMGIVYRARDARLDRAIALKLLPSEFSNDDNRVRRFRQEARAISALNHPNILTIYEIGETITEHGLTHFIATEFVEGQTLRGVLSENELTLGTVLDIAIQTVTALSAAHAAGVIHRDLKPENIMLRPDGVVKILDFGLAKLTQPSKSVSPPRSSIHTDPGLVLGTVSYMSPEQARGFDVDERSDVFSVGVVLYELLTGQSAFAGATTSDVLAAVLEKDPIPLLECAPHLPVALGAIITQALAKERRLRYQRTANLLRDLKTLRDDLAKSEPLRSSGLPSNGPSPLQLRVGKSDLSLREFAADKTTLAPVTAILPNARRTWSHSTFKLRYALIILFLVIGGLALAGIALWPDQHHQLSAIAVLPFANVGNDPQLEYLSEGVTDTLIQHLQHLQKVRVMARGTVYAYKDRNTDPRQLGSVLQVQAIINGSVQQRGDDLVIRIELIDAHDGASLWSRHFQRSTKELPLLQAELTDTLSEQLGIRFGVKEFAYVPKQTRNSEAYRLYLLGNHYANKQTLEGHEKALAYYQQALELDSQYELAYSGLANLFAFSSSRLLSPQEAIPQARQAALRALELNPDLAEAHFSLALIKCWGDWEWSGAEQEFKRALTLNPNLTEAHTIYANLLSVQRRFAEFHYEIQQAKLLDPFSSLAFEISAWGLYFEGRYDDAIAECQKLQKLDPSYLRVYAHLGNIYQQKGQLPEAIATVKQGLAIERQEQLLAVLAYLYGLAGQTESARQILNELETTSRKQHWINPLLLAKIHVGLGQHEQAFDCLQQTYEAHSESLMNLGIDPVFAPLHPDPRFQELVQKIGLQR
ncbi:MAG TPA: protein kinase [Blastocatellia bacterium]|nr:protein kinase [Blastocatellia bacterium]